MHVQACVCVCSHAEGLADGPHCGACPEVCSGERGVLWDTQHRLSQGQGH